MTENTLTPTPPYTISGTGPYAITHGYSAKADITATVILANVRTVLVLDTDYFVSPDSHQSAGTVTLSAAAATAYATGILYIKRATNPEQGWLAVSGPREAGLEAQLDAQTRAAQDQQRDLGNTLRADFPLGVLTLKPSSLLGIDASGVPYFEDPNILAQLVPDFAQTQAYIDGLINGRQPLHATLTQLSAAITQDNFLVGDASGGLVEKQVSSWAQGFLASGNFELGLFHLKSTGLVRSLAVTTALALDDRSKFIDCTAALTLNLLAAATAVTTTNAGFHFHVRASGGDVIIDASGAELINGLATITIPAGESALVYTDGVAWFADLPASRAYTDGTLSSAADGYQIFPSGLILQWGQNSVTGDTTTGALSFPMAFPNAVRVMVGSTSALIATASAEDGGIAFAISSSQFKVVNAAATTRTIHWMAIGY